MRRDERRPTGPPRGRPRSAPPRRPGPPSSLLNELERIDGEPWPAYRRILGEHDLGDLRVIVDRIPPDPFAGGARVRLVVERTERGLPAAWTEDRLDRIAAEDHLARDAERTIERLSLAGGRGTGGVSIQRLGPSVIERSAVRIEPSRFELRITVELPAAGRRIHGLRAAEMFDKGLRRLAHAAFVLSNDRRGAIRASLDRAANHRALQESLRAHGLVAFLAEGSLLARAAGNDSGPRHDGLEQALQVPDDLAVTLKDTAGNAVRGLGIPAGVTVIVGGAFHGKSTVLEAIAAGVHAKFDGDGREGVVTRADTVTLRAEDGRSVRQVDLSGFFSRLPSGVDVSRFDTERASGSTSQGASLIEALEAGACVLLIDEDKAATNFMIRDGRMQRLVPRPSETIIPFIDRVRELYETHGVSSVIVTGGSGDYLEVADTVVQLDAYRPVRRTEDARRVVAETGSLRRPERLGDFRMPGPRRVRPQGEHGARLKVATRGERVLRLGNDSIDVAALDQLSEAGQSAALAALLRRVVETVGDAPRAMPELLDELEGWLDRSGLDELERPAAYGLSRPRRYEIAAALNRWRSLRFSRPAEG